MLATEAVPLLYFREAFPFIPEHHLVRPPKSMFFHLLSNFGLPLLPYTGIPRLCKLGVTLILIFLHTCVYLAKCMGTRYCFSNVKHLPNTCQPCHSTLLSCLHISQHTLIISRLTFSHSVSINLPFERLPD